MHQLAPPPHLPGATAHRIPIEGVELAAETLGHGPAVLLWHGGVPHTRAIWCDVAPRPAWTSSVTGKRT